MKGYLTKVNLLELETKINNSNLELEEKINNSNLELEERINSNWENLYPIHSIYTTNNNIMPSFGGQWELIKTLKSTDWNDFSYTNSTYYRRSTQDFYTRHQWKVEDNILYVQAGAGCSSTINHSSEDEIARIPIQNGFNTGTSNRIWNGAVGGSGAVGGFYLTQETDYIAFKIKPHTSASNHAAPWYATFINVPLDDNFILDSNYSYTIKYLWKRVS